MMMNKKQETENKVKKIIPSKLELYVHFYQK